jgi:aminopeptidase N
VERYFNDAKTIWENKTFKIAEYLLERLYPANLASKELANITRKWLERNQKADRAMRRMIIENLANVERALVAQAKDLES